MEVAIVAVPAPIPAVVVDIDMDVVTVPIAAVREPRADSNTGRKRDDSRRMVMLDNNDIWIVGRHIDHGGTSGEDGDRGFLRLVYDLIVGNQIAGSLRVSSKALDRCHHLFLLVGDGVAEIRRPIEVLVHLVEHLWIVHQRKNAGVKIELLDRIVGHFVLVLLEKPVGLHDFEGVGRCRKNDRNQLVRIQRDWPDKFLELSI